MAVRLKRRSSIGVSANNKDCDAPTLFTQSTENEQAERKARNLQRKKVMNDSLERDRLCIGGSTSELSAAQLAKHYNNCIKLSTRNVINMQLIDYMASMTSKKKSDNNFQDLPSLVPVSKSEAKKRNNRGRTVSAGNLDLVWPFSPIKRRPQGRDGGILVKTKQDVKKDPLKGVSARSKALQKPQKEPRIPPVLHTRTQTSVQQLITMFPESVQGSVETAIDQLLAVSVDNGSSGKSSETRSKSRKRAHSVSIPTAPFTSTLPPCPECPVCYSQLVGTRIFQCGSGHHICQQCKDNPQLKVCPTCREKIMGRATNMEQFLATLYGRN